MARYVAMVYLWAPPIALLLFSLLRFFYLLKENNPSKKYRVLSRDRIVPSSLIVVSISLGLRGSGARISELLLLILPPLPLNTPLSGPPEVQDLLFGEVCTTFWGALTHLTFSLYPLGKSTSIYSKFVTQPHNFASLRPVLLTNRPMDCTPSANERSLIDLVRK